MKRIAFITLFIFAAGHVALAKEKEEKQPPSQNAAAAKAMAKSAGPGRQFNRSNKFPGSNFNGSPRSSVRLNQPRNFRAQFNTEDGNRRFSRGDLRMPSPIATGPSIQGNVSSRGFRGPNAGRNWRNANANLNANNSNNGNWQNRGGNNNNNNWANRGERWRQRHGNWNRHHHDRRWWRNNFTRFALFGGGYYYWNSGYWYPAYGYDPYFSTYTYDAPIYAYNDQDPGQVIANVQVELQRRGYSPGGVDGTYGPMTRNALIRYQSDNGLPATGEIDEETLGSLGLQ